MIVIATPLTQWDTGRSVNIQNIVVDHVHFANKGDSKAVIMEIKDSQAKIPDYLLQTGKELCVYAVSNGVTIERKSFFVTKRERPENYVYEEDQRNFIYALIEDAQEAIKAAKQAAKDAGESADRAKDAAKQAEEAAKNLAPLVIGTSLDFGESPGLAAEIYQAAQSGREVILTLSDDEEVRAYLSAAYPDRAVFTANGYNPHTKLAAPVFYIVSDGGIGVIYATDEDAVLALIASGGNRDIDMGDRGITAGWVDTPVLTVRPADSEGFDVRSSLIDDSPGAPVAEFFGSFSGNEVVLRNIADGEQNHDAVNKAQLDAAVKDLGIPFNVSGTVAQVFPVSGSPVKVSVINPGDGYMKLYCVGKNLFDPVKDGNMVDGYIFWASGNTSNSNTSLRSAPIPVSHLIGKTLSIAGAYVGASNPGWAFYKADNTYLSGGRTGSAVVPEGAAFFRFTVFKENITSGGTVDKSLIQVEIGDFSTNVETYREIDFAPTSGNIALDRSFLNGVNTFYAYTGTVDGDVFTPTAPVEIRVVGYQHPAYEIEKQRTEIEFLKSAILSLGANV